MPVHCHNIPTNIHTQRLSDYGKGIFPGLITKSSFKKAIKRNEILVDGKPGTTGHLIKPGEKIVWNEPDKKPRKLYHISLNIVYEDDHLAVVNKPAGVVVSGNQFRTLENALPVHLTSSPFPDALPGPKAIHRLDSLTSGLIIIAKTSSARIDLSRQMEEKKIRKVYHAVVIGETEDQWTIKTPVDGKPAITEFEKLKAVPSLRSEKLTLVKAKLLTGRTHQIRKHLSEGSTPILGDKLYGKDGLILKGKGLFLCATEVTFLHPETAKNIHLKIDMPPKFLKFLEGEKQRYERLKG